MGFEYDPRQHAGRIDQVRPGLVAALESLGYQVHATDDELALRLDVLGLGRLRADLRFGADGNGLLTLVMRVGWLPAPDARLPELLARFNAGEELLTAVSLPSDDGGELVELWLRMAPALGVREPYLPDALHGNLELQARAKVRLAAQLAGELGAQPLDPPRENTSGRYARPGARSSARIALPPSSRLKRQG
ncbi:MAG: hypothetical protein KDD82_04840 [Planctomycetes bacterium]|nr:hypothetical protein [Planctomycetota bacterium]